MTADLRLALPATAAWVAAIVLIGMPPALAPAAIALWVATAASTAAALLTRRRWTGVAALTLAAAALVCTSAALQATIRQPAQLVAAATANRTVTLDAVTTQTVYPGDERFEADVLDVGRQVPVLVFGAAPAERLGIGTRMQLRATLAVASDGDDRAFLVFPEGSPEVIATPPPLLAWADQLRATFLETTQQLPGDGGDLLAGLAIGDTSAVSEELDAAMKASSLTHLTAVSGANCAIVVGLVLALTRALGMPRAARVIAALAMLLVFVVLVTPEPSVLRAAVMSTLVLFALLGGRSARGLPMLALAVLVLLVGDPWLARNFGFALSVLATAGLLLLAGPIAAALARWLPRWLAVVVAVPLAAQVASQPVIVLLDASLPTYGVIANLLAAPAAPLATIVGLAACVAATLVPPLGTLLAALAWIPSAWIAAVAGFFAAAPAARLPWPGDGVGAVLLIAATAVAVAALLRRGRVAIVALLLAVTVYAGVVAGGRVVQLVGRPADWQIAACDVGQGDAFLVRSAGRIALIDTGAEPKLLRECLADLGVAGIDVLVLSHYDLDHVGALSAVRDRVATVIVGPSGSAEEDRMVAELAASGARVQQVVRGTAGVLGDLRWRVLWPPTRLGEFEPGNDASVVVAFEPLAAGQLSSVFLGDVGEASQRRLMSANALTEVDVVKVAHHGSADQFAPVYDRLSATVGVIGVGQDNDYGHPTPRLLDILAGAGTVPVRTDQDGLVLLAPGEAPGTVRVWTQR